MSDGRLRSMTSLFLTGEKGILCLYRIGSRVANELYVGSAGGHFEKEELSDARACVLRELKEELGLEETDVQDMRLRYITLRLKNGEIRQNYYFFGTLKGDPELQSTEGRLQWFTYDQVKEIPMPASARNMMDHYLAVGRWDEKLYGGVSEPGGAIFRELTEFAD